MSFPLLFTIDGASRHELVLVSTSSNLKSLNSLITKTAAGSANCVEWGSKFKKQDEDSPKEQISEIKVAWCKEGRDMKTWPATTVLTQDNIEAVLATIEKMGVGKDVLVVKMEKAS